MRALLIVAALAGLAGCARVPYAKTHFLRSEGYSDRRRGEGVWDVTFRTAGADPERRYQIGALYRSAELAREAGFPFFQVVRFQGRARTLVIGRPPNEKERPYEQTARLTVRGVRTRNAELKCESAPTDCATYSTEETLRRLAPRLMQPPPGQAPESAPPPG